ncbi:MAG: helix-turn-helix transcriptional regulator [Pseudonocardiaceae bacterium]
MTGVRRRTALAGARKAAGHTQEGLAAELHVDRSTVIRWEAGDHAPLPYLRPKLARLLGRSQEQLQKLIDDDSDIRPQSHGQIGTDEIPVVAPADPDEFTRFSAVLANPQRTDAAVVEHFARVLAEQRCAEDTLGARRLLGPVLAQIQVIDVLIRQVRSPVRTAVLEVKAHYEEFAGWMRQDATDSAGALRHYDVAMDAAQEIGDADMITSVLSLKSHLAWADNNAARAIELAVVGQREPQRVSAAVLALIAQQEARGHALDGDVDATERALDRSAELTYSAAEHPEDAPPWVYFHGPQRLAFQRGVAYVELGRHAEAAPLLSTALESLPDCYERDRARYAAQLALALAGAGDADGALVAATRAAELAAATGSALATRELRRVRAAMRERGADSQARALAEHIRALADELC